MKTAVQLLLESMTYQVPEQDLSVDLSRIPALPRSGFVMARPRRAMRASEVPIHATASTG
jgi:fatty-acid peroxygenase